MGPLKPDLSTPALCLEYLRSIEVDGERIGYLVHAKTGVETPLSEATDQMLLSAAKMVHQMIAKPKRATEH